MEKWFPLLSIFLYFSVSYSQKNGIVLKYIGYEGRLPMTYLLTSLNLSFLVCHVGIIVIPSL